MDRSQILDTFKAFVGSAVANANGFLVGLGIVGFFETGGHGGNRAGHAFIFGIRRSKSQFLSLFTLLTGSGQTHLSV